jgi:hypothetical protein
MKSKTKPPPPAPRQRMVGRPAKLHLPEMRTKEITRRLVLQTFDASFTEKCKKPFAEGRIRFDSVVWSAGFEKARQLSHEALFDMLEDGTLKVYVYPSPLPGKPAGRFARLAQKGRMFVLWGEP